MIIEFKTGNQKKRMRLKRESRKTFMRAGVAALLLSLALGACKNTRFEREFGCETPLGFSNTKTYKDVLSHFEIDIPKSWKTSLYYDEYQSKLYTADTTRNLSESYIIDVTWHQGELVINEEFDRLVSEQADREFDLVPVKSGEGDFLDLPAYYHISTGKKNDMNWHYLQVYLKYNTDEYYTLTSKIYGNVLVTERICASFALFKELEFID
jgi:hypothetical protein